MKDVTKTVIAYVAILIGNLIEETESVNYYWKNFNGDIPNDAVKGGDGIYVGLGLVFNEAHSGLIPGTIRNTNSSVYVALDGLAYLSYVPKILCSQSSNFIWLKTSNETLIADLTDRMPVQGGMQSDNNINMPTIHSRLFIGRFNNFIGKVPVDTNHLLFYADHTEYNSNVYEILIYNNQ